MGSYNIFAMAGYSHLCIFLFDYIYTLQLFFKGFNGIIFYLFLKKKSICACILSGNIYHRNFDYLESIPYFSRTDITTHRSK